MFGRKRIRDLERQLTDAGRRSYEQERTIADLRQNLASAHDFAAEYTRAHAAAAAERDRLAVGVDTLAGQLDRALHQLEIRLDPVVFTPKDGGPGYPDDGSEVGPEFDPREPLMPPKQSRAQIERAAWRSNGGAFTTCPACPHDKAVHDGMGCTASCNCRVPYHSLVKVNVKP